MNSSSLSKRAFDSVRIVGSGLIGTSIGLGLTAIGVKVTMVDADKTAEKMAQDLMATPPPMKPRWLSSPRLLPSFPMF